MGNQISRRAFLKGVGVSATILASIQGAVPLALTPEASAETTSAGEGIWKDVRLTLVGGVISGGQDGSPRDIELDFIIRNGSWEREVWGFAPNYNKSDHWGTAETSGNGFNTRLDVSMVINADPWVPGGDAHYSIDLVRRSTSLEGSYTGTFNGQMVTGTVGGQIEPPWPAPIKGGAVPVPAGEHPRLIFCKSAVPTLRARAQTPDGKAIVSRLRQIVAEMEGDLTGLNAGPYAAGLGFLYVLTGNGSEAEKARQVVERIVTNSVGKWDYWDSDYKMILRAYPLIGVAQAYDLCYDAWDEDFRARITAELNNKAAEFIANRLGSGGQGYNNNPWSNWNAETRGAVGMASLAVLGEPGTDPQAHRSAKIAERSIKRYLLHLGDRAWDQEGDDYLRYSMDHGVLPFLQAHRNVTTLDLVSGSSAEWLLPYFIAKLVHKGRNLRYPVYGTAGDNSWYRNADRSGEFSMGLGSVPNEYRSAALWAFDRFFGSRGDGSYDVINPDHAIYALTNYPTVLGRNGVKNGSRNPTQVLPRAIEDHGHGGFIFRSGWEGALDFVATMYLKENSLHGAWAFPDAGSFRIFGLGGEWASKGKGNYEDRANENVVLVPGTRGWFGAKKTCSALHPDGSGIVSMDMDNVYLGQQDEDLGIRGIRSFAVDYSGASGAPGLFVAVDRITGSSGRKTWLMHTSGKVTVSGNRFTVQDSMGSGSTMVGTFVAPGDVDLSVENDVVSGVSDSGEFFVVMTVQRGLAPEIRVTGAGLNSRVTLGGQTVWFEDSRVRLKKPSLE